MIKTTRENAEKSYTFAKTVTLFGDTLDVRWAGGAWVSPSDGRQHARARDAMRAELEAYFSAGGDDVEDEATAERIGRHLDTMTDAD